MEKINNIQRFKVGNVVKNIKKHEENNENITIKEDNKILIISSENNLNLSISNVEPSFIEIKAYFDVYSEEFNNVYDRDFTYEMSSGFQKNEQDAIDNIMYEINRKIEYYQVTNHPFLSYSNLHFKVIQLTSEKMFINESKKDYAYNELNKKDLKFIKKSQRLYQNY